jgi:hypothetical protein
MQPSLTSYEKRYLRPRDRRLVALLTRIDWLKIVFYGFLIALCVVSWQAAIARAKSVLIYEDIRVQSIVDQCEEKVRELTNPE